MWVTCRWSSSPEYLLITGKLVSSLKEKSAWGLLKRNHSRVRKALTWKRWEWGSFRRTSSVHLGCCYTPTHLCVAAVHVFFFLVSPSPWKSVPFGSRVSIAVCESSWPWLSSMFGSGQEPYTQNLCLGSPWAGLPFGGIKESLSMESQLCAFVSAQYSFH